MHEITKSLRWVLHGEKQVSVSTFADLEPKDRPLVLCPACRDPVTLKLGEIVSHHAAHKPESTCEYRHNGESALHLNAKLFLRDLLLRKKEVLILGSCPVCARWRIEKNVYKPTVWVARLDEVRVEERLDAIRPDLSIYRAGELVAAIEVYASHKIDAKKRRKIEALAIPCIELRAEEIDDTGVLRPFRVIDKNLRCSRCLAAERAEAPDWKVYGVDRDKDSLVILKLIEKAETSGQAALLMVWDAYSPAGKHSRCYDEVYLEGGTLVRKIAVFDGSKISSGPTVTKKLKDPLWKSLAELLALRRKSSQWVIADVLAPWDLAENVRVSRSSHPPRYHWDKKTKAWMLTGAQAEEAASSEEEELRLL